MRGNSHVPFGSGEKSEIISKIYLSTSAAYAVVGFQTAYLMRYYPTEFIAAMLNSVMGISEKVAFYIRFAKELGIEVLPPDINESFSKFTVNDGKIRFGMAAIKNVGVNVIDSMVESRIEKGKFISLTDFYNKIDVALVNKRAIESLIKAGAFDCFKVYRSQMLAVYEKLLDGIHSEKRKNIEGQLSLFTDFAETSDVFEVKYPKIKEFEKKYLLAMEKEMTGLYISGHPLEEYEDTLNHMTNTRISEIVESESLEEDMVQEALKIRDGDRVVIGGLIAEVNKKVTRKNDMMAFIRLEDMYGDIEVIVFPKVFHDYKYLLEPDSVVIISGRVSIREEEQPKILCERIEPLVKLSHEKVYVLIENERLRKEAFDKMKSVLQKHKGNQMVYICTKKERQKFRLDSDYWITINEEVLDFLKKEFGEDNIKVQ